MAAHDDAPRLEVHFITLKVATHRTIGLQHTLPNLDADGLSLEVRGVVHE